MPSSCRSPYVEQEDVFKIVQARRFTKSGEGIACEDASSVNDSDPVAEFLRLAHDVRGEDDGSSVTAKLVNGLLNFQRIEYVEADCRFVENNNARVVRDGSSDRHLLLHAGREFLDPDAGVLCDSEPFDQAIPVSYTHLTLPTSDLV